MISQFIPDYALYLNGLFLPEFANIGFLDITIFPAKADALRNEPDVKRLEDVVEKPALETRKDRKLNTCPSSAAPSEREDIVALTRRFVL